MTNYFTAVTGMSSHTIDCGVKRLANLQRAILIREGRKVPEADFPLEFNFAEPLTAGARGQKVVLPGPDEEIVEATGNTLDREKFTDMLKEYYDLRGWERETGQPKKEILEELGLNDLISSFK